MGNIGRQIKAELKKLPFTLGKLVGALMAVIGFPGIIIITRKSGNTFDDILPYLILGIAGISVFIISSICYKKYLSSYSSYSPSTKEKVQTSLISWTILLIVAAVFILAVLIITANGFSNIILIN